MPSSLARLAVRCGGLPSFISRGLFEKMADCSSRIAPKPGTIQQLGLIALILQHGLTCSAAEHSWESRHQRIKSPDSQKQIPNDSQPLVVV